MFALPNSDNESGTVSAIRKTTAAEQAKRPSSKTMSIGVVITHLREEFPDVTVSKIRFLESEGLITPERTQSGYRRFTDSDIERLRYILTTQRDNYLPLKVIREQLDAMDEGSVTSLLNGDGERLEPIVAPESFSPPPATRLSDADVAEQAQCEETLVHQCIKDGLIAPDSSGLFTVDDARVVSIVHALEEFGIDSRHLKTIRQAAVRQADMISQVADPVAKSRKKAAKQEAEELSQQMTSLVVSLHASLVKNELRRHIG